MNTRSPAKLGLAFLAVALAAACHAESKAKLDLKVDNSPIESSAPNARATSYADVVEPVQKAVVSVYSSKTVVQRMQVPDIFRRFYGDDAFDQKEKLEGLGSGVIVSKNGYILTNNHVVAEADELEVALADGRKFEAKLIGTDPKTDVAVIKIEADDLPIVTVADSDNLRVGDLVFAIGNPLGVGQTVTMGIVSATGRNRVGILEQVGGYEDFIQTDASINQGNSGGALIDARGRLIGINTAILSGRAGGNIGIGFAIPANLASTILTSLVETGSVKRGLLGITGEDLKPEVAESLGLKKDQRGAIVTNLPKDSPATKGGLQRSDVIIALDGRPISGFADLRNRVSARPPGATVELRVLRDGKERTIKVTLGSLDTALAASDILEGVTVEPLSDEVRRRLGAPRDLNGLAVTAVAENSPYASRLAVGMVIVEINREAVSELDAARSLLKPGRNLLVVYVRGAYAHLAVNVK